MNPTVRSDQRLIWTIAFIGSLGLALLGAGTALAQSTGMDFQGMLQACQQAMASLGISVSLPQMQAMMSSCIGQMGMGH